MPSLEQPDILRRFRSFDLETTDGIESNLIRMVASTNAPVRVPLMVDGETQMWDEVLEHEEAGVDISAARSLLLSHNPNAIIGAVKSIRFTGDSATAEAEILPDAILETGVRVIDAVRAGALKGVSIGYTYRMDDDSISPDYEARCLKVRKWRMLEISLTSIPADPSAGVRSLTKTAPKDANNMSDPDIKKDAPDVEAVRSEAKAIAALADSHHLRSADYVGLSLADAQAKILSDIAARDAAAAKVTTSARSHIEVGEGHAEKVAKRAVGAMMHLAGFRHVDAKAAAIEFEDGSSLKDFQSGNSLRGRSMSDILRATLSDLGVDTGKYDRHALAQVALGKRDASNLTTGFFSNFVFLNLISKSVSAGFQMGSSTIKYEQLVSRNYVPDYKQFAIGGLGTGNLTQTVEDTAFPELAQAEGVFLDRVKMWGGTMSLTEQAIVSDDTGRFMDNLRMAGVIAKKTIDKRVFQKLLMGTSTSEATATWTNNTTSATIVHTTNDQVIAARANLAKVESALMNKVGLDGNPTGNMGAFLIVPPDLQYAAAGLLGVAPGQQNNLNLRYQVVSSPWLQFSGLTGNSATSYYLLADPNEATGLVVSTINGIETPRVEQYDPGAVAAYKWKIYMPFEAHLVNHTVGSTATIAAAQQGT